MASITEISRILDYKIENFNNQTYLELLQNRTIELNEIKIKLLNDYDNWKYCFDSRIIKENILKTWNFDGSTPEQVSYNLIDFLDIYVKNAVFFIEKFSDQQDYRQNLQFLIANGIGDVKYSVYHALDGLIGCEESKIEDIYGENYILIIVGIVTLSVFIIILGVYIEFYNKNYNRLWNLIKEYSHAAYFLLKANCLERLTIVHGTEQLEENTYSTKKTQKISNPVKFSIYLRFLILISCLIIVTLINYSVVHLYLYPKCKSILIEHPRGLVNFTYAKTLIPLINFWNREVTVFGSSLGISNLLPDSLLFKSPTVELYTSIFYSNSLATSNIKDKKKMNDELSEGIFVSKDSETIELTYGTHAAVKNFIFDSLNIIALDERVERITDYSIKLQEDIEENFVNFKHDTEESIENYMNYMIYAGIIYCVVMFLLFLFYYLPFINRQIKILGEMEIIIGIIPLKNN